MNAFAAAALEIAVGTHCRQTLAHDVIHSVQSSTCRNNTLDHCINVLGNVCQ